MARNMENLAGRTFGRLTVLSYSNTHKHVVFWLCECACGGIKTIRANDLRIGYTQSCGCLHKEAIKLSNHRKGVHGKSPRRLYRVWQAMKDRCYRPGNIGFHLYGGRGIKVCRQWKNNFLAFRKWALQNGYRDNLWLDRIKNHKGYSPENCRFLTPKDSTSNRRCTKRFRFRGCNRTVPEIAELVGMKSPTLNARLRHGMPIDQAAAWPLVRNVAA
jgi:hypothetical protein